MSKEMVEFSELEIPMAEIYDYMGYKSVEPDEHIRELIEHFIHESSKYVTPCFEYHIYDGSNDKESVIIESLSGQVKFNTGRIICNQLRNVEKYVVFVATVGIGYDKWIANIKQHDDILFNFVADSIGSQLVESTANSMEKVLQKELDCLDMKRTNRFSPGYCGWHLSEQPFLFGLFPDSEPCGVQLTNSSLMLPIKSVSGFIGIGHEVRYMPYPCNMCDMTMCYKRKLKRTI
ncbi:MAG TPA: vitamin B12 dependent-methionine synthase activation domain-containing protein [Bacteroidaceae bacterium]|nr:vitamin B12 dependent-methionine synthase activation domain-containing protein [Bacteroidaceae bacterium]